MNPSEQSTVSHLRRDAARTRPAPVATPDTRLSSTALTVGVCCTSHVTADVANCRRRTGLVGCVDVARGQLDRVVPVSLKNSFTPVGPARWAPAPRPSAARTAAIRQSARAPQKASPSAISSTTCAASSVTPSPHAWISLQLRAHSAAWQRAYIFACRRRARGQIAGKKSARLRNRATPPPPIRGGEGGGGASRHLRPQARYLPSPHKGRRGGGQATRRPRGTRGVVTSGNPPGPRAQTTRGLTLREPDGASERAVVSSEVQAEPMGCAPPTRASARTAPSPTRGRHPNEVEGGRRRSDAAGSRLDRRPARGRRTRARDTWQWKDGGRRGRAAAFERGVSGTEVSHRCPHDQGGSLGLAVRCLVPLLSCV